MRTLAPVFLFPLFATVFAFCLCVPSTTFAQSGAPESDPSNIPRTISATMDRLRVRDLNRIDPREQKTGEMEESCLLPPLTLVKSPLVSAAALAVPSKAKKEYLEACEALHTKKTELAERHLRNAVQKYSKYSIAWVTLGQLLAAQNNTREARSACTEGSTAEPNYVPAYLCLAELAMREKAWADVLQYTTRVLQLDPNTIPIAYEYSAAANLRSNQLDEAERMALRALEIDKNSSDPRIHFVLAQIYEAKHDREKEAAQLREYLKFAGNSEDVAALKLYLLRLENAVSGPGDLAAQTQPGTNGSAAGLPSAEKPSGSPGPPEKQADTEDLDQSAANQDVLSACNLDEVLPEVEHRVQEFVGNVQSFTATEHLVHETFGASGQVASSERWKYDYVVSVSEFVPGLLEVSEYQNARSSMEQPKRDVATKGLPALLLIFHPYYAGDFSMHCEGLTTWNGKPAWQIRFRQRADKPNRIRSYTVGKTGRAHPINLKGRAWFLASNYQVVRLDADLIKAVPEIGLAVDHTSAEYGPVHFQSRGIDVWLPQSADLVSERKGKRFHERITFSDYFLFQIDNQQHISSPEPQDWLAGLMPLPSHQEEKSPVSVVVARDAQVSQVPD